MSVQMRLDRKSSKELRAAVRPHARRRGLIVAFIGVAAAGGAPAQTSQSLAPVVIFGSWTDVPRADAPGAAALVALTSLFWRLRGESHRAPLGV